MREVQVGATVLMECGQCQATWVDSKTFDEICADQTAQAEVLSRYSAPQSDVAEVHYRRCVACGKMMNRLNFARLSGTIIDVCKGHGAFLDAGELHAIVAFIRQGGLDRARQRQIDELKEEEERIRALQAHREGNADVRFEMRTRTWSGPDLATLLDWLKKP
jgi:Zn-finger nucleic acid-binding protein